MCILIWNSDLASCIEWCAYLIIYGMLCIDIFWMVRLFKSLWYVMFWYFLNGAFIWKFVVCYVLMFFEWCVFLRIYGMLWLSYICCCTRYYCWINVRLRKKLKYVYKVFKGIRAGYTAALKSGMFVILPQQTQFWMGFISPCRSIWFSISLALTDEQILMKL